MVASKPIFNCNYLKLYSCLGYFPCMKSNDGEQSKLIPISWKLQLLLYFFSTIIPVGIFMSLMIFVVASNKVHFITYLSMLRASDNTELDIGSMLYLIVSIILYGTHMILQLKTRQIKDQLCELQSILNQNLGTCMKKYSKRSPILYFLVITNLIAFAVGFYLNLNTYLNINLTLLVILIIINLFSQLVIVSPTLVFYYIYGEISRGLEEWILGITQELEETHKFTNSQYNACRKLLNALKLSASALSFNVFLTLSMSLIAMTAVTYMNFDYFLSHADFTSPGVILVFIGYIAFIMEYAYIVWIFNYDSEHLCDQVKLLKNTLDEIYIEDHEFVFGKGGQLRDARFARNLMVNQLQDFRGFDGLGYFTLGKPLLTSITANILTYLIVLIQFKISE